MLSLPRAAWARTHGTREFLILLFVVRTMRTCAWPVKKLFYCWTNKALNFMLKCRMNTKATMQGTGTPRNIHWGQMHANSVWVFTLRVLQCHLQAMIMWIYCKMHSLEVSSICCDALHPPYGQGMHCCWVICGWDDLQHVGDRDLEVLQILVTMTMQLCFEPPK